MERLRGCLSGYGGITVFPSKADRIMSRYRPIAPKPAALPCISDADRSASSALTYDNLCVVQVPDAPSCSAPSSAKQKSKRVRKRLSKEVVSEAQQPTKRLAMGSFPGLASEKYSSEKVLSYGLGTEVAPLMIQEDVGFMERAAASAPLSMLPLEKTKAAAHKDNFGCGGCFTEMIRGIAGLPTAAHVHNLLQQQPQQQQAPTFLNILAPQTQTQQPSKQQLDEASLKVNVSEGRERRKDELHSDALWSCFLEGSTRENGERAVSEELQQSGLDEEGSDGEDDGRRKVVTLNLLPEVPIRVDSPMMSTCSSFPQSFPHTKSTFDNSLVYIEQVYGHSSEPVVLVDDVSQRVLWVNQGYVKACKDNSNMPAPFIDPLGIPTQLGQFQVQLDGECECTSVTLWGFLKKLVVDLAMANQVTPRWLPYHISIPLQSAKREDKSPSTFSSSEKFMLPQQHSCGMLQSNRSTASSNPLIVSRVIQPQPVRLVGSVVSLESVTEIQNGDAMVGILEIVKKQLEEGSLPGFITDMSNVVRWVNTAYKVMVGQPECPWLVSTMKVGGGSPTITGEVVLSCNVEVPTSATSFSGRANIQWTRNTGERSCMTVPCDVLCFLDSNVRRMLVWKFDILASLSLTCGGERKA